MLSAFSRPPPLPPPHKGEGDAQAPTQITDAGDWQRRKCSRFPPPCGRAIAYGFRFPLIRPRFARPPSPRWGDWGEENAAARPALLSPAGRGWRGRSPSRVRGPPTWPEPMCDCPSPLRPLRGGVSGGGIEWQTVKEAVLPARTLPGT